LQLKLQKKGTTLIVGIIGELDHHSTEYIRQRVDGEIIKSTTKNIVFDFSKVNFMDSSGIGMILGRYKNVESLHGKTAIINANSQIRRIFEMSGILRVVPIHDNIENAINSFEAN
jgi:stage II sporulation protein AA (anti-sigma F factor antagonist)